VPGEVDWLRARGMGRERFAGYIADYLTSIGYQVERTEQAEPAESRIVARLVKMNPAVPESGKLLEFRLLPTSGGCAAGWVAPTEVPATDRERLGRLVREMTAHLERSVMTESHAAAKVQKVPDARLPWESAATGAK
jgi:hypothetical protein